jgi:hypothetical protein
MIIKSLIFIKTTMEIPMSPFIKTTNVMPLSPHSYNLQQQSKQDVGRTMSIRTGDGKKSNKPRPTLNLPISPRSNNRHPNQNNVLSKFILISCATIVLVWYQQK